MHNFVYLAQRRSQKFSREPNFGKGERAPRAPPVAAPLVWTGDARARRDVLQTVSW